MQAGFLPALPAPVTQYSVSMENQSIGNQLLVTLVLFGFASVYINHVGMGGDNRQVFFHFQVQTLEHANFFEKGSLKTKDSFFNSHIYLSMLMTRLVPTSKSYFSCWQLIHNAKI